MIVYHYSAFFQPEIGQLNHIDGILKCELPILDMDRYHEVKKAISPEHYDKLTISSLTLLRDKP
jgi:hypothetical protein